MEILMYYELVTYREQGEVEVKRFHKLIFKKIKRVGIFILFPISCEMNFLQPFLTIRKNTFSLMRTNSVIKNVGCFCSSLN